MGGAEAQLHSFSTSTADGDEWELLLRSLKYPGKTRYAPNRRLCGSHCGSGGWVEEEKTTCY